jgi:tetratricopeptide (TPR) repeat protein
MPDRSTGHRMAVLMAVLFAVVGVPAAVGVVWMVMTPVARRAPGPFDGVDLGVAAVYVGAQSCRECHEAEYDDWVGSHHDLAMQHATDETVLGDFGDVTFVHDGHETRFFRRGGSFVVEAPGADGELREHEAVYAFGVEPLQQYLLDVGGGRYQALTVAWDTRPAEEGGQRWFDLYPGEDTPPGDELHWSAPVHNWNFACAECHSTDLRKGYDLETDTYETTWAEIDVSCEACHGPGSLHVEIARIAEAAGVGAGAAGYPADHGLVTRLQGPGEWRLEEGAPHAFLAEPNAGASEVESCGRCHARRTQIAAEYAHGQSLSATHRLQLLHEPYYFDDGQILDEVFVYGSFRQSLMHARGVTCSDCHEPHSLRLRAEGNTLCASCHAPSVYDVESHHFHEPGTEGASCVACHMPSRHYMVVDPRADHSMRIPRPDLTVELGVPNACGDCHEDESASWAAEAVAEWYGADRNLGRQTYAHALHASRAGEPGAAESLEALAMDPEAPTIARATALAELGGVLRPASLGAIRAGLGAEDPLMRRAAVESLAGVDLASRWKLVSPLLDDDVLGVRLVAAETLADASPDDVASPEREALERAFAEYVEAQRLNGDRAEHWVNLAGFWWRRGDAAEAERAFDEGLRRDAGFVPIYANRADMYRAMGREEDAERALRAGLAATSDAPALRHALGLLLVRTGRRAEAFDELGAAYRLAPEDVRFGYVYGVALQSAGDVEGAIGVWESVLARHPNDVPTLQALGAVLYQRGELERAREIGAQVERFMEAASAPAAGP